MTKFLAGLWIVFWATCSYANEGGNRKNAPFLNLALSYFTEEGYPASWYVEASPGSVTFKQNFSDSSHGAFLTISGDEPVVMYTPIIVNQCVKRLEASVSVKSANEVLSAVFFINPQQGGLNAAEFSPRTRAEQRISHQIQSSDGCFKEPVLMGIMLKGSGTIDLAKFELYINDERFHDGDVPTEEISRAQLKVLQQHAVSVKSFNLSQPTDELDKIKPWVKQAKIIGLGENSHGAKNLFFLKSKLIQYLVETQGFTQVALEMPAITAQTVDDYIQGKHHDRNKTLLALNYPSWQTESMMALIDWLRRTNKRRDIPVIFSGFDVQQSQLTLAELKSRITKINDTQGIKLLKQLTLILSEQTNIKQKFEIAMQNLALHFKKNNPTLKRYISVLKQGLILERAELGQGAREEFMASQVLLISRTHKTILWGDNTHISKQGSAMGSYIASSLGQKYKAIGFSFHEGTYSAYGPNNPYVVHPSISGSHDSILNQIEMESFLLNLTHLPKQSPLLDLRGFRYIGSRPQNYTQFYPHRLKEHFDIIGFVKNTAHTKYLVEHKFE